MLNDDIRQFATGSWMRNFTKSVKYAVVESVDEHLPIYKAYKSSANEELKYARKELSTRKRFFNFFTQTTGLDTFFKDANLAYKNMKTSMRSGAFYNPRRANKAQRATFEAMGIDTSDLDEIEKLLKGEGMDDSDEAMDEDANQSDSKLERDLESGLRDNSQIVSEAVSGSAEFIAATTRGAANLAYAQNIQAMKLMTTGFDSMNRSMTAINDFNSNQMMTHIQNATQFFESTSSLLTEQTSILKQLLEIQKSNHEAAKGKESDYKSDNYNSIIDPFSGAIDFKKYFEHVKENFENRSMFGMVPMFWNIAKQDIINNPMQFLLKNTLSMLGGSKVEKALDDLQKNIMSSIAVLNAKLVRGEAGGGGILGSILSLFGIHEDYKKYADTKFDKGPMQFNGAANKAITEVIPMYLARIEAKLTGQPIKVFDMESGTWTTSKEVREKWDKDNASIGNSLRDNVRSAAERTIEAAERTGGNLNPKQQEDFQKMLVKAVKYLKSNDGIIDKSTIMKDGKVSDEFLRNMNINRGEYDPHMVELLGIMFNSMQDSERRELVNAAHEDKVSKSKAIEDLGIDPYNVNRLLVTGALNGTNDAKYHLTDNSYVKMNKGIYGSAENALAAGDRNTSILKAIYDEIFGIHTGLIKSVFRGGGGSYGPSLGASAIEIEEREKSKINFDNKFSEMMDRYEAATNVSEIKTNGFENITSSTDLNIEDNYKEIFDDFFKYVRGLNDVYDFSWVASMPITSAFSHAVRDVLPATYDAKNFYVNRFLDKIRSGMDDYSIYNLKDPDFVQVLRIIKRSGEKRKDTDKDFEISDAKGLAALQAEVTKNLGSVRETEDAYSKYKGSDFFEKLGNANGLFEKLGVITSKAKSVLNTPINYIVNAIDTVSGHLGNVISGEKMPSIFSGIGNFINNLLSDEGKAYGGTIGGDFPRLYALSPGEKVIPADKNYDNPNRKYANTDLDAIKENFLIQSARKVLGDAVGGGFAKGKKNVMGRTRNRKDDKPPHPANLWDVFTNTFGNITDIGSEKFRDKMDDFLLKYIEDKELLAAAREAVKQNDPAKLQVTLTGITAKDIVDRAKSFADNVYGSFKDAKDWISKYIPQSVKDKFNIIAPYIKSGAAAGAVSGLLGGPFGLIGGALMGTTVGIVQNNDEIQNVLFGPGISNAIQKFFGSKKGSTYAAVGATVGGLVGGPFGAVGGLMLGTGLNFVKTSDTFQKYILGPKGLISRMDHFFGPTFMQTRKDIGEYIQEAITKPIENAMIPVGTALQIGLKKSFELLDKGLKNFVKPTVFNLGKSFAKKLDSNKYLAGAVGGAAGGALMGGPVGAILGGVVGSIAHGTGFDKKITDLGKLPGKMLTGFSNKLAAWEIQSGNGFNWSATERIEKMKTIGGSKLDKYMASEQYKLDTKLKDAKREDLIDVEMLLSAATGKNVDVKSALNETLTMAQNALITGGATSTTSNKVLKKISDDKDKANISAVADIIEEDSKIPADKKKNLLAPNGNLAYAIERYATLCNFEDKYLKDEKGKAKAVSDLAEWGIDAKDKSQVSKATKLISKEKVVKPLEKKADIVYTATTAIVEYGEKIGSGISSGFSKIGNYLSTIGYIISHRDEYVEFAEDGTKKSVTKIKKQKKGSKETVITFGPNGERIIKDTFKDLDGNVIKVKERATDATGKMIPMEQVGIDNPNDKQTRDEELEKAEDKAIKQATNDKLDTLIEQNEESNGFLKTLGKSTVKAAGSLFGSIFAPFDNLIKSIPVIGDLYEWGKMKVRTGAKAAGIWAKNKINEKIVTPIKTKVRGWAGEKARKITGTDAAKTARGVSDWLNYKPTAERLDFGYTKDFDKALSKKQANKFLKKMEERIAQGKMPTQDEIARMNEIKETFKDNKAMMKRLDKSESIFKAKDEALYKQTLRAQKKATFNHFIDARVRKFTMANNADRLARKMKGAWEWSAAGLGGINIALSKKDKDLMNIYMSSGSSMMTPEQKYRVSAILKAQEKASSTIMGKYGKKILGEDRARELGKLMTTESNMQKMSTWAGRFGKAGAAVAKTGASALGKVAKFAGKFGGKVLGAAFDILDTMAVTNAMEDADKSVQAETPEEAAISTAHSVAQIAGAMPVIGEFIRRQSAGGGLADLAAEGGKAVLGKAGITAAGGAATGAAGTAAGGIGATIGAKVAAVKGAAATAKGAVVAEAAATKSSVVSFIKNVFSKVINIAKKFLKPETIAKFGDLTGTIIKNVSKPSTLAKLAPKVAATVAKIATGPIGWAIMAGFVAHSFYKGFDDAEKIWKPKEDEELTVFKKALCGVANVLYNDCLLSIVFNMDQIIGFIKQLFHDPEDDVNKKTDTKDNSDSKGILQRIRESAGKAWEGLTSGFTKGYDAVSGFLTDIKTGIKDTFGGFIDKAKEFGEKVEQAFDALPFKDGLGGLIESALAPLKRLYERIFGKAKKDIETVDTTATPVEPAEQLDSDDEKAVENALKALEESNKAKTPSASRVIAASNPANQYPINKVRKTTTTGKPMPDDGGGFFGKLFGGKGDGGWFKFKGKGDGGKDNAQEIWDYLSSKGLGSSAIAGIMGNIQAESSFNPRILQDLGNGAAESDEIICDGNRGYGLCQWTSIDRQRNLAAFAKSKGKKSGDLHTQLDFLLEEANNSNPGLIESMSNMDPHQAALLFHKEFERSADTPAMAARRGNFAKDIFAKQGRGITTAGTYAGSNNFNFNSGGSSTSGGGGGSTSGGGLFSELGQMLENSYLGKLGTALFGSASYFTGGIFGGGSSGSSSTTGGGSAGGAGSSRSYGAPNKIGGKSGCADYKQDDERWWDHPYTFSTVAIGGCMPSSFCNMASMYGVKVIPPDACDFAGANGMHVSGGTECRFYPAAADKWGVPVEPLNSWDEVLAHLRAGKPVAAGFWKGGGWSNGGHWMLMTHIDAEGNVYVADSRAGKHDTGRDISGYHRHEEARDHWAGPGYAFGAKEVPTSSTRKRTTLEFLTENLGGNITGKYGETRSDGGKHGGIDIATALGKPITSPIDGSVSKIAYEPGGYGNYVQIKDTEGKYHLFAHLKDTPKLDLNHKVKAGDPIGLVGSSGLSSGPHLHYQIDPESNKDALRSGQHIDPSNYELSESIKGKIEDNNNNLAAIKGDNLPKGDGGFFTDILNAAKTSGILGTPKGDGGSVLGTVDYSAKFDTIISILTMILEAIKGSSGGNTVNGNVINDANKASALVGASIGNKMNTTTPGQNILSIVQNMLKIATN